MSGIQSLIAWNTILIDVCSSPPLKKELLFAIFCNVIRQLTVSFLHFIIFVSGLVSCCCKLLYLLLLLLCCCSTPPTKLLFLLLRRHCFCQPKATKCTLWSNFLQNVEEREWFCRNFELMRTKTLSTQRKVQLATIMLKSQVCVSLILVCISAVWHISL